MVPAKNESFSSIFRGSGEFFRRVGDRNAFSAVFFKKNAENDLFRLLKNQDLCYLRLWAPLFIGFRRLFAIEQIPIGKIFGGCLRAATHKSSCIVLFARLLKIHPTE